MSWSQVDWKAAFRVKKSINTLEVTAANDRLPIPMMKNNGSLFINVVRGQTYFLVLEKSSRTGIKLVFNWGSYWNKKIDLEPGVSVPVRIDETYPNWFRVGMLGDIILVLFKIF